MNWLYAGWAPHAYFQIMEEQEELRLSNSRRMIPSSNGRQPEQDSPFLGLESGMETIELRNNNEAALTAKETGTSSI